MNRTERTHGIHPIFSLEKLQERRLLSAELADAGTVAEDVTTDTAPADEVVILADEAASTDGSEGADDAPIRFTFFALNPGAADPEAVDPELGDPASDNTGEADGGDVVIYYMMGGMADGHEMRNDSVGTLGGDVLQSTGADGGAVVESAVAGAPRQAPPPASASVSSDLLGSKDDLLGGGESIL